MIDWTHTHLVPFLTNATWQSSILIAAESCRLGLENGKMYRR